MDAEVQLTVNGVKHAVTADPDTSLLEILREDLGLTGAKYGCGESQCGACTVLMGNQPVHSCVTSLSEVGDKPVITIEWFQQFEKEGKLHAIQQAFIDEGAMQCGYCVTGMIMAASALLQQTVVPTDEQIVAHMNGNVCRCGGYPRMVAAIKRAGKMIAEEK
jgi:aerobic-type carbon monoxide dehydrogenase small subunit (CoxS/CutS family)